MTQAEAKAYRNKIDGVKCYNVITANPVWTGGSY